MSNRVVTNVLISFLFYNTTSLSATSEQNLSIDATSIDFEQLLQTEYIPASHIANQISNASSAVSIVTAQDIKDYGYRTLGEILSSMRGVYVSQSYAYSLFGGRGFSSNEYAGRIIVLIDGYRADDSMFGQAYLGNDGILDVALIDRVEYIPGGGSSGYGDGALLGAINIITKKGSDIDGTQLALGVGSHHGHQQRVSFGQKFDNGVNILLNASSIAIDGTIEHDGDNDEKNKRFFAKIDTDNFSFQAAYAKRDINLPYYSDNPLDTYATADENGFVLLKYHTNLSSDLKFSSLLWYGQYTYSDAEENYSYSYTYNSDNKAKWYGGDVKLIATWLEKHTLSVGAGYRNDFKWSTEFVYEDTILDETTYNSYEEKPRETYNFYVYDDFTITPYLSLNYGVRYEKSEHKISSLSPRAALIYAPWEDTRIKLSVNNTHRQATPSEGEVEKPEHAELQELVTEQQLGNETKLTASLYRYRISDRITYGADNDIVAKGAEIEFEKHWVQGARMRASIAWQQAKETDGTRLPESPSKLTKFNLTIPLFDNRFRFGTEFQYIDERLLYAGSNEKDDAFTIININFLAHHLAPNLDINFLVHDLLDKSFQQDVTYLPQSGRNLWLQLEYTF